MEGTAVETDGLGPNRCLTRSGVRKGSGSAVSSQGQIGLSRPKGGRSLKRLQTGKASRIGAKVVSHRRYVVFQMAAVAHSTATHNVDEGAYPFH